MIRVRMKRVLRAGCVLCGALFLGCTSTLVHATPSSAELKNTTSAIQGELHNLNAELNALSGEMDSISDKIKASEATMAEIQARMDEAQLKGEEQYEAMKLRIKHMYEAGDYSFIELLCTSESMSDFLNKTDYIKTVSEYDRDMLNALRETQEEIKAEGEALQKEQDELTALKEELADKCATIKSKISSKAGELKQYQKLLAKVQAAEQAASNSRPNSKPNSKPSGGSVNSVTPPQQSTEGKKHLGTFKITHYCPCYYCCGAWGNATASGVYPTAGRTIAVDPSVIPLGTKVIINGYVYVAEDTGGAIKGKKIDIFVNDHQLALNYGTYYTEVYLAE